MDSKHSYEIQMYVTKTGVVVFEKWINGLKDKKGVATILGRIRRVSVGLMGDCKSVGDGVFELRVAFGPGYRVYFSYVGESVVLLLIGGDKSSQRSDITKAKAYLKDHKERT